MQIEKPCPEKPTLGELYDFGGTGLIYIEDLYDDCYGETWVEYHFTADEDSEGNLIGGGCSIPLEDWYDEFRGYKLVS